MNRRFYLIDRENGNEKRRITMRDIVDHFVGDGTSCIRWNRNNVDLDRFRDEMDEIGYTFVVDQNAISSSERQRRKRLEARLRTASAKLQKMKEDRPRGDVSDRVCRRYMEELFAQLRKVHSLEYEIDMLKVSEVM